MDPRQTFAPVAPGGPTLEPRKQTATITPGSPRITIGPSLQPTLVPPSSISTSVPTSTLDGWMSDIHSWSTDPNKVQLNLGQKVSVPLCDEPVQDKCVAYLVHGSQVDASGDPVSAKEAADHVVELLGNARSTSKGEALGVQVSTTLEAIGLRDKDIRLSWSLLQKDGDTALPDTWQHSTMSYVLTPSTDHDSGAVDLWVPLPKAKGTYVVQLTLRLGDSVLTSAFSPEFG